MGETTYKPGTTISRTISTSSAQSAAIGTSGRPGMIHVRLYAVLDTDDECFVQIGADPEAAASGDNLGMPLQKAVPEYVDVAQGDKIAVIVGSGAGTLYITEVSK